MQRACRPANCQEHLPRLLLFSYISLPLFRFPFVSDQNENIVAKAESTVLWEACINCWPWWIFNLLLNIEFSLPHNISTNKKKLDEQIVSECCQFRLCAQSVFFVLLLLLQRRKKKMCPMPSNEQVQRHFCHSIICRLSFDDGFFHFMLSTIVNFVWTLCNTNRTAKNTFLCMFVISFRIYFFITKFLSHYKLHAKFLCFIAQKHGLKWVLLRCYYRCLGIM